MTAAQSRVFKRKVMKLAHQIAKQMTGNRREVLSLALRLAWGTMKVKLSKLVFVRKWVAESTLGKLNEYHYYSKENQKDIQRFSKVFAQIGSKFVMIQGNTIHETPKAILFAGYLVGKTGTTTPLQTWIPKSMMTA
jgi:hypothetical protein